MTVSRILFLHSSADLYGSDRSLLRIVTSLDRTLFEPFVVLPCEGPLAVELRQQGASVRVMELGVWRRRYANPWGVLRQGVLAIRAICGLQVLVRSQRIDLIVSNTLAVVTGALLSRVMGVPHVWYMREMGPMPWPVKKALVFLMLCAANKVVAVSEAVRAHWQDMQPRLAEKITVIHNGLAPVSPGVSRQAARKILALPQEGILVGLAGRINRMKGQDVLLDIAKVIAARREDARFICVGDTLPEERWRLVRLQSRVAREGFEDRFIVRGFCEEMETFYQAIDILAVPSMAPDAFPGVCLEAALWQRPVIGFDTGGIGEIVRDGKTGTLVKSRDVEGFAAALEKLLADPALRDAYGREAKSYCEKNFSLAAQSAMLRDLFYGLVGNAE